MFVWAGQPLRVAKHIIYIPLFGFVLLGSRFGHSEVVTQPRQNPAVTLEAAILGSYAALSNLVFRGPKHHPSLTSSMCTTIRVWRDAGAIYQKPLHMSPKYISVG